MTETTEAASEELLGPSQNEVMRSEGYLSVKEAAYLACVNPATIYRMISTKKVVTARSGQKIYIELQSLADHYQEAPPIYKRIMNGVPEGVELD